MVAYCAKSMNLPEGTVLASIWPNIRMCSDMFLQHRRFLATDTTFFTDIASSTLCSIQYITWRYCIRNIVVEFLLDQILTLLNQILYMHELRIGKKEICKLHFSRAYM